MSEDEKIDDQDNVGGTIRITPHPEGQPLPKAVHQLRNQIGLSKGAIQYSPTTSAYTSAEVLTPDLAPMIKDYQASLRAANKADVFALSTGMVSPQEVGIPTELKSDVTQTYAEFEYSERDSKTHRWHEYRKYFIGGVVTLIIWAMKEIFF